MTFIDLTEFSDLFCVDILLPGTMPEHILNMEWIAVGRFQDFSSIEFTINDPQIVVIKEIIDHLHTDGIR